MSRLYEVTITNTGSITVKADNPEQAYDIVLSMSQDEIIKNANLCGWEPSDVQEITDEPQRTDLIPISVQDEAFWIQCKSKNEVLKIFKKLIDNSYRSSSLGSSPHEGNLKAFIEYYKDMLWKPTCFLINRKKKVFCLALPEYMNLIKYPVYNAKNVDLETL